MKLKIFISSVQREFAEERRWAPSGLSWGLVGAQSGRSQGAVATGEMFDLVGEIRIEAERDCCRGENA